MTSANLTRRERWALTILSGGAPVALTAWARRTLEASDGGRAAYSALVRAEQVAAGVDVTRAQSDAIGAALLSSLDAEGTVEARGTSGTRRLALAGAAIAVAAFFVWTPPATDDLGELSVRGLGEGTLGVTVRCLQRGTPEVVGQAAAGPGRSSSTLRCGGDRLLSFAFTNTTADDLYAMVVGVNEDDELRWYAPFSIEGQSTRVQAGAVDAPLAVAADLAPMPDDERVVLRAIFSRRPMRSRTVGDVVDQARTRHLSPSRIDRLPLTGTLEARVELLVTSTSDAAR